MLNNLYNSTSHFLYNKNASHFSDSVLNLQGSTLMKKYGSLLIKPQDREINDTKSIELMQSGQRISNMKVEKYSKPGKTTVSNIENHAEYQAMVRTILQRLIKDYNEEPVWLAKYNRELLQIFNLNLDNLTQDLIQLYSSKKVGKPAYNPVAILRSLLLMILFRETSITHWVAHMRRAPWLAAFAGFKGKIPAVGTYYNFMKRLENSDSCC